LIKPDEMVKFIEKSDDVAKEVKDAYDTLKSSLDDIVKKLEDFDTTHNKEDIDNEGDKKIYEETMDKLKEAITVGKSVSTTYFSALSTVSDVYQSLSDAAAKEFMTVLRRYADAKEVK